MLSFERSFIRKKNAKNSIKIIAHSPTFSFKTARGTKKFVSIVLDDAI